jgi:aromatic ring-opening dioxygenase LigB subunit
MPLVYACIAPHGGELVPNLVDDRKGEYRISRNGMKVLATQMKAAKPDTIVVASPHNLRLLKHIGVVLSENTSGRVKEGRHSISLRSKCDLELGRTVVSEAEKRKLPVVAANYGGLEGPASDLAMDWGSLIPLWHFIRSGARQKVLIVTPSRGIPLGQNFEFGRVIGEISESVDRRVAFVASADQAHAHRKDGPYGYSKEAAAYDRKVREAIKEDRLKSIMKLDPRFVEAAKPDSLWQMVMLAGVLDAVPMKGRLFSYQVPTYFGMLCAGYTKR